MKKLVWVLAGALIIIFTPVNLVRAEETKRGLLIAEVQTGSSISASEEFIELFNQSEETLDLTKYKVEYFSAAAVSFSTPSRVINLSGTLYPGGRYLITSSGYLTTQSNTTFAATLAKTGGHIRIVTTENDQPIVHDLLGWGSALMPETLASDVPDGGESLQRKITVSGEYQDSNNNSQDFIITTPSPESNNPIPPQPEEPVPPEPTPEPVPDPQPENPEPPVEPPDISVPEEPVLSLLITELLPNPGSPGTDANDEFIELYNPNGVSINLKDYRLETGKDFSYHYVFDDLIIGPGQYLVVYAKDSNLVLSNSGGRARLLHPNGTVLSETDIYGEAKENKAWAVVGSTWQWTDTLTPGQANIITIQPDTNVSAAPKPKKPTLTAKHKTAKAVAKPKVASAKSSKPKASSAKAKKTQNEQVASAAKPGVGGPVHPLILAAVGVLALGYAGYEYRTDIANKFRQLRGFRKNRPTSGEPT